MENTITQTVGLAEITAALATMTKQEVEKVKYAVRKELNKRKLPKE